MRIGQGEGLICYLTLGYGGRTRQTYMSSSEENLLGFGSGTRTELVQIQFGASAGRCCVGVSPGWGVDGA